jgi:hypothetical protein
MDPEFRHMVIVILIAGLAVVGAAVLALFFAFRAFGTTKAGNPAHFALILGLVAFILLCCVVLLRLS